MPKAPRIRSSCLWLVSPWVLTICLHPHGVALSRGLRDVSVLLFTQVCSLQFALHQLFEYTEEVGVILMASHFLQRDWDTSIRQYLAALSA